MDFQDLDLDIFHKGDYQAVDVGFLAEAQAAMKPIDALQVKYKKPDTDTFVNEVRDSLVGRMLGYDLINVKKHGFDAKMKGKEQFLEVKQASFSTSTWGGTFNDTNLQKADAFKDEKMWLAVALWYGMSELIAVVYGQNRAIGDYLEERVRHVANTSSRSTQNIPVAKLLNTYGFRVIVPPTRTVTEVRELFLEKIPSLRSLPADRFIEYEKYLAEL